MGGGYGGCGHGYGVRCSGGGGRVGGVDVVGDVGVVCGLWGDVDGYRGRSGGGLSGGVDGVGWVVVVGGL